MISNDSIKEIETYMSTNSIEIPMRILLNLWKNSSNAAV
jgi:hypothetical protein